MAKSSDPIYIHDGSFSWAGGVDSSLSTTVQSILNPDGLPRNELAWLNNATVRGGSITQRAGWKHLVKLPQGYWQGHATYEPDDGFPYVVCVISGVVYQVDLYPPYQVTDLTGGDPALLIPSDPLVAEMCFFCQAENYLIIQAGDYFHPGPMNLPLTDSAGRTLPLFWNGTILRRSAGIIGPVNIPGGGHTPLNEIPAATAMDYYENRVWYAQGRQYSAGDIVGGPSGDPALKSRDAVLKVTENPLAIGGDGFTLPTQAGNIRAIVHASQLNASLGQGSLYVGTRKAIYNPQVPITRKDWILADKNNMPSQPIVQLVNGPCGHRSIIPINGDLYYQAFDPAIRSLIRAVQYFAQPGNTAISQNVDRALKLNDRSLMRFASSIYFDSRLLTLVLPKLSADGVNIIHQAILPLDFDVVTNLSGRNNAVWEGAYDGLQFIELIGVDYSGQPRAFAAIVSDVDSTMNLWELTNDSKTENGDNRITWAVESPAYTWSPAGYETELKQLSGGELWVDRVSGTVQLDVYYRPDGDPCWRKWFNTKFCASRNQDVGLGSDAYPCEPLNEGAMYPVVFPEPCGSDCDAMRVRPTTIAYQFQVRLVLKGFCRIRGLMLDAQPRIKAQYQGLDVTSCQGGVLGAMAVLPFTEQPQVIPACVPPGGSITFPPSESTSNPVFSCSIITSTTLPHGKALSSYGVQIEVESDLPGWIAQITAGSLPPGLTMSNNGMISGIPDTLGTYAFQITVTKTTFMSCFKDFTLVVDQLTCSISTGSPLPGGITGVAYSTQIAGTFDVPPTAWTITAGSLPDGLTLNSATGIISGTPTTALSKFFGVTATGPAGMTCHKNFVIAVALPTCTITTGTNLPGGTTGSPYSVQLAVSAQATVTSWGLTGTLPTGLTMNSAGLISGTPTAVETQTFTVTVTMAGGQTCSKSFTITTVQTVPVNTAVPTITGTLQVGSILSGSNGTWTNSPTGYSYRWLAAGVAIVGSAGYTDLLLTSAQLGKAITFEVTATNAVGNSLPSTSAATTAVQNVPVPVNTAVPTITGTLQVGSILSGSNGTWTNSPTSYARRWLANGSPIGGATGSTFTLTNLQLGQTITFEVTATNVGGNSAPATSAATSAVQNVPVPVNSAVPTITGTKQVGFTLTGTNGTWTNSPTSYAYQWLANGVAIGGATGSTFLLTTTQSGQTITFRVTATNAGGASAPATSNATSAVAWPPNKPLNLSPPNGHDMGVATATVTVTWNAGGGGGSPTTTYDVYLGGYQVATVQATQTYYTFYNLGNPASFPWYVVARNAAGDSTPGDTWSFYNTQWSQ